MDKLVKERESNIQPPKTVKEYQQQKNTVYSNKSPDVLLPNSNNNPTDKTLEDGAGGFAITELLQQVLKWGDDKN